MTKIDENMRKALADYIGPVTRCPPGHARAPDKKAPVTNGAAFEWLKQHRADQPTKDAKVEHKQRRRERAQRERIARRNAAVLKRIGKVSGSTKFEIQSGENDVHSKTDRQGERRWAPA